MTHGEAAIRHASGPRDIALARMLIEEYARWLGEDLCFQGFERELATLPGSYAPPRGRLLLAGERDDAFGCIALHPLDDENASAEVKRLWVQPRARGGDWGRRLTVRLIDEARAIGYRELKLDTLRRLSHACALYQRLGFVECEPYYHNPIASVVYMRLPLD
jgi:putative acetyltransferase